MVDELNAAAAAAKGVDTIIELAALAIIASVLAIVAITYLVLVSRKTRLETAARVESRNAEVVEINNNIASALKEAKGVGKSLDEHLRDHERRDTEIFTRLGEIEKKQVDRDHFDRMQEKVHSIEVVVVQTNTMVKDMRDFYAGRGRG
ncbi:MAG: hypothetical protein FWB85_01210 [Chitinispirillia bacterium]|nr:hypothetical protein [Chitinispirillia bacterium]MCL2241278.1 hypothetical protein [Chitinispirillia bacterium]